MHLTPPVLLRRLLSPRSHVQRVALRALLALVLHMPEGSGQGGGRGRDQGSGVVGAETGASKIMMSVLETVLGMAFLPESSQPLQLLNTLAAQPQCASHPPEEHAVLQSRSTSSSSHRVSPLISPSPTSHLAQL